MSHIAQYEKKLFAKFVGVILSALFFLLIPFFSFAATLGITPASGSYAVGQTFSVSVQVSSPTQALNAVSGLVSYSKDQIELISISKSGSIISLWAEEPSYSNQTGSASFEGIVLNPGFIGNTGKVITYTFRAKSAGSSSVKINTASVLANDGSGTNIFASSSGATFTITAVQNIPLVPLVSLAPVDPLVFGTYPILEIKELARDNPADPIARFSISVVNTKEVFKKYELRLDQGEPFVWEGEFGKSVFTTAALAPGTHTLLVKTLDAKKPLTGFVDFNIQSLEKPNLVYFTKLAGVDQPIVIYGTTQIGNTVTITFYNKEKQAYTEDVRVDNEGKFLLLADQKLPRGIYTVHVVAHNASMQISSEPIEGLQTTVTAGHYIKVGSFALETYLVILVLDIVALLAVIAILMYRKLYIKAEEIVESAEAKMPRKRRAASKKTVGL